ncbi:HD-GYP domain-containing protein [Ectothiorhodospira shaposhnikovii]|uniref:HD-GYP domain-containing protein n=1 Tax=Ectothiorhodospira shaposhnikovii TaxID=1054 RepID=UPI001EE9A537|nr:HD-GYP domain-containing protein [Ectothiorhodospira shaposhnikovii]MCG5511940.1 HD-GYP domain-containing protein [Ectothiorhodospira shaposhnikovii]
MLKKIRVEDLKLGVYITEFCGSWLEHPFWRTSFLLSNPNDLNAIQASHIKEVWIDSDRGEDVDSAPYAASLDPLKSGIDTRLEEMADISRAASPVDMEEELTQARKILHLSREAVAEMFSAARMGNAVDMGVARNIIEQISNSLARNPSALISLSRLKQVDEYTYMHSVAVAALMMALARELKFDQAKVKEAGMAGLMHDIGKAAIPRAILNKPGRLTNYEFGVMKSHPRRGGEMLLSQGVSSDSVTLDVCLHHHEKMDGSGYPHGLAGDQISMQAKMGAVCDVYDAITSNRPYREGWDPSIAIQKMMSWAGGHFDQRIFQAFVKTLGIYPVGSLVRLSSGKLAIVMEQSEGSLLKPIVRTFYSVNRARKISPVVMDLSRPGCDESIIQREDPRDWGLTDVHALCFGDVLNG